MLIADSPADENTVIENQDFEKQFIENHQQLNTKQINTNQTITKQTSNDSCKLFAARGVGQRVFWEWYKNDFCFLSENRFNKTGKKKRIQNIIDLLQKK